MSGGCAAVIRGSYGLRQRLTLMGRDDGAGIRRNLCSIGGSGRDADKWGWERCGGTQVGVIW